MLKIRPTENWKLLGANIELSTDKTYDAIIATNQPNYEKNESIFAGDVENNRTILLHKGEYDIV